MYLAGFLKTLAPKRPFAPNSFFRRKTISKVAIIKTKSAIIGFFLASSFLFLLSFSFVSVIFSSNLTQKIVFWAMWEWI